MAQGLAELRVERGSLVYRRTQRPPRPVAEMPPQGGSGKVSGAEAPVVYGPTGCAS